MRESVVFSCGVECNTRLVCQQQSSEYLASSFQEGAGENWLKAGLIPVLAVFLLNKGFACKSVCLISTAWPSLSSQCFDGQSKRLRVTQQGVDSVSFCLRDEVLSVRPVEVVFENSLDVCRSQRFQGVNRELPIRRRSLDFFKIRLPVPVCCAAGDSKIRQPQSSELGFDLKKDGLRCGARTDFI